MVNFPIKGSGEVMAVAGVKVYKKKRGRPKGSSVSNVKNSKRQGDSIRVSFVCGGHSYNAGYISRELGNAVMEGSKDIATFTNIKRDKNRKDDGSETVTKTGSIATRKRKRSVSMRNTVNNNNVNSYNITTMHNNSNDK